MYTRNRLAADRDKPVNSEIIIWNYGLTQGYQLHQSLQLRFFKSDFDNVLQKRGGLPHVPDTQGYSGLVTYHLLGVVAHKILVTAQIPLSLLEFVLGRGLGLGLVNCFGPTQNPM